MLRLHAFRRWFTVRSGVVCGLCVLTVATAVVLLRFRPTPSQQPALEIGAPSPRLARVDADIALWEGASQLDSFSAYFPAHAAALYMQRARLTGDVADAERAEARARKSLALRTQHNGGTFVTLSASLLEQHRFKEARDIARQLVAGQPDVEMYHSLLGETQLELGDYDGARASFAAVRAPTASSGTLAGAARWAELQGHTGEARKLLRMGRATEIERLRCLGVLLGKREPTGQRQNDCGASNGSTKSRHFPSRHWHAPARSGCRCCGRSN